MSVTAAIASVNATIDLIKTAIAARDEHKITELKQVLGREMLEVTATACDVAQKAQASIDAERASKDRQRELEEKILQLEKKSLDRDRYELYELSQKVVVLTLKPEFTEGEPAHYLCQPCMDNRGKKAILQRAVKGGIVVMTCPECRYDYPTGETIKSKPIVRSKSGFW